MFLECSVPFRFISGVEKMEPIRAVTFERLAINLEAAFESGVIYSNRVVGFLRLFELETDKAEYELSVNRAPVGNA